MAIDMTIDFELQWGKVHPSGFVIIAYTNLKNRRIFIYNI